ncbi:TetR/AcrR family transcriptional regulator [Cellulosilyticum lentocellum]|uniref:Regulatory protein TetR n=1 Tax=Cellulosilyticum lentocellum (strain ATCC 49066 / DSM 5427 / NCIMB 11756 / RHM5) TaxID=642492 RepID=F2JQ41_CELLD|nr:TetR/AcrR family transcriptional regulator [Cellulosilyticum lentocellum]ADZ82589.1 regulatory protein TetR [Cellulosilyticum lentocellum DSM 5427]
MMYQSLENFSLRKINYVKTRTTILKTAANLLKQKEFSEITVDEICQKAQISRGTFFNYFSTKEHIFHYFIRIFTVKIALRMKQWKEDMAFEDKLKEVYQWFLEEKQYTEFTSSYINFLLTVGEEANEMKLIDAEFVYFFNGIKEEEYPYYNELTLGKLFEEMCEKAKARGEITLPGTKKELSALVIGVITGTYLSDHVVPEKEHLAIMNRIWKS